MLLAPWLKSVLNDVRTSLRGVSATRRSGSRIVSTAPQILEDRTLLATFYTAATSATAVDLTVRNVVVGGVEQLQVIQTQGGAVLASADISSLTPESVIIGSGLNDVFRLDVQSANIGTLTTKQILIQAGNGTDSIFVTKDSNMTLTGTKIQVGSNLTGLSSVESASLTGGNGAQVFDVSDWSDRTATLNGAAAEDTYKFGNNWGKVIISDPTAGVLDFLPQFTGQLSVSAPSDVAGRHEITGRNGVVESTLDYSASVQFSNDLPRPSNWGDMKAVLSGVADVGRRIQSTGKLAQSLSILNGQSLGEVFPIDDTLVRALEDSVSNLPVSPGVDSILSALNSTNGVTATALYESGNGLTIHIELDHQTVLRDVELGFADRVAELLQPDSLRGDLSVRLRWSFDVNQGAATSARNFSALRINASVNKTNFDAAAGFLGLHFSSPSTVYLASDISVNTAGVSGTTSFLNNLEVASLLQTGRALSKIDLTGSTTVSGFSIQFPAGTVAPRISLLGSISSGGISDLFDLFDSNSSPVFAANFDDTGLNDEAGLSGFYQSGSANIYSMFRQFRSFLETFATKELNSEAIPLTKSKTVGDLVDLKKTFQDEFLTRITLPPHTAATLMSTITDGEPFDTSGNPDADIRVTLRNGTSFSVDLDAGSPTTLGAVISRISTAAISAGVTTSQFSVITNADGSLSLTDWTSAANDSSRFSIETFNDRKAASQLGLDSSSSERDIDGDGSTEFLIDVALNPGPNFRTFQKMVALANSGTQTVIPGTGLRYNPTTKALQFVVQITRVFPERIADLVLPDLGSLTGISSSGVVTIGNASGSAGDPQLVMMLPFELSLKPSGFSEEFNSLTEISLLNRDKGVPVVEGAEDLRFQLRNGTTFTVDLDMALRNKPLSSLKSGAGLRTNGTSLADISIRLNDGTIFPVDLDTATTLGDVVTKIQSAADQFIKDPGDFEALIDTARGTLTLIDHTLSGSGGVVFRVSDVTPGTGTTSDLGLDTAAESRVIHQVPRSVIEKCFVTVGDLVARIKAAAAAAGLILPTPGNSRAFWNFDVQIEEENLVVVDRTAVATALTGQAGAGASGTELKAAAGTQPFGAVNRLVGRFVTLKAAVGGTDETLKIVANTGDTLTMETAWEVAPALGQNYEIPTLTSVSAINDSRASMALGLSYLSSSPEMTADSEIFDSQSGTGFYLGTNGTVAPDLIISLSSFVAPKVEFNIDLDGLPQPATLADIASRISGGSDGRLEVYQNTASSFYLIDRARAGLVSSFTVRNGIGSTAASDLQLDLPAADEDVDYAGDGQPEYSIPIGHSATVIEGGPLHGDTPSAHLMLLANAGSLPHIRFSVGLRSSTIQGSAHWGDVAVDISGGSLNAPSAMGIDATFYSSTLRDLSEGLEDPSVLMQNGEIHSFSPLNMNLTVAAQTGITGVGNTVAMTAIASNIYDLQKPVEALLTYNDSGIYKFLNAVEFLTVDDLLKHLDSAADYLMQLQEGSASQLSAAAPGLSRSVGQLQAFGDRFRMAVSNLRLAAPVSLQDLQQKLTLLSGDFDTVMVNLSFDSVTSKLKVAIGLDLKQLNSEVLFRLSLQDFATSATISSLGLDPASLILDTFGSAPVAVRTDGTVNLDLGVDLASQTGTVSGWTKTTLTTSGTAFGSLNSLAGDEVILSVGGLRQARRIISNTANTLTIDREWSTDPVSGSSTYLVRGMAPFLFDSTAASLQLRAENSAMNFQTTLGVIPAQVNPGSFVLNNNGVAGGTGFATYQVGLNGDRNFATAFASTDIGLSGGTSVNLPLIFSETFIPSPTPTSVPFIRTSRNLSTPSGTVTTNLDGVTGTPPWPKLTTLVSGLDLRKNLDGLRGGFNSVFTRLNDLLNKAVFGLELPFVGTQLAGSVDFVEQIRTKVLGNLSTITGTLTPEKMRQALYDAFGPGGLNWLQDTGGAAGGGPDGGISLFDDITLPSLNPADVSFQLLLNVPKQHLSLPVDLNLLLPGLGLQTAALADVRVGFRMPLLVGLSRTDGAYLGVAAQNDITVDLELGLPSRLASMTGNPQLTFSNSAGVGQIRRESGSWLLDGFVEGQQVTVAGSAITANNASRKITNIDPTGRVMTLDSVVVAQGPVDGLSIFVAVDKLKSTFSNLLPVTLDWNQSAAPQFRGTFLINLRDASGNNNNRLSSIELESNPALQGSLLPAAPVPELLQLTADIARPLTMDALHFMIQTDFPAGTAFPGYRWDLDISNWTWTIANNTIVSSAPTVAFNNVQIDLVSLMRDFLGASLTRMSVSLQPIKGIADFLDSEAMPIVSLLFGRGSYVSSTGTFGGDAQIGDFLGAYLAIDALVNGGVPFKRDALTEALTDLFEKDFDNLRLVPILQLAGEAWIDLGAFTVSGAAATGSGSVASSMTGTPAPLGSLTDKPLKVMGDVAIGFQGNTITRTQNPIYQGALSFTTQKVEYIVTADGQIPIVTDGSITGPDWNSLGLIAGESLIIANASGFNGEYLIDRIEGTTLYPAPSSAAYINNFVTDAEDGHVLLLNNVAANTTARTWADDGFELGQVIRVQNAGANSGDYTITAITDTTLTTSNKTSIVVANGSKVSVSVSRLASGELATPSIMGQVIGLVGTRGAGGGARDAANSFLITQLIPGKNGFEGVLSGVASGFLGGVNPIQLPILTHSFDLLTGNINFGGTAAQSSLMTYDTPELFVALYQDIPLDACFIFFKPFLNPAKKALCPILSKAKGAWNPYLAFNFEARAREGMAFDTTGLERFRITRNAADIVDGFYFDQTIGVAPTPSLIGTDSIGFAAVLDPRRPQAQSRILGGIGVGVYLGFSIPAVFDFKIGTEITFFAGRDLKFHDPDENGKIRASEFDRLAGYSQDLLVHSFSGTGADAFDSGARFEIRWDIYAKIKVLFTILDLRINLLTFSITVPVNTQEDPTHDLATLDGSTLWLNIGAGLGSDGNHNAAARGYRSAEIDESLYVGFNSDTNKIIVSGFGGQSEEFDATGITLVKGFAGTGHDRIFISSEVLIPIEIHGGEGDDEIHAGGGSAVVSGDAGNDLLLAGLAGGFFEGGDGHDTVYGLVSDIVIHGGFGNDRLFGGRRDDEIEGNDGIDTISGGPGADRILGHAGNDVIAGDYGDDEIEGGSGLNVIDGGDGADTITGGDDADVIHGGPGNDHVTGGGGDDSIFGDQHNDAIYGGSGKDRLDGGGASDRVWGDGGPEVDGSESNDVLISRDGSDFLDGEGGSDVYLIDYRGGKTSTLSIVLDTGAAVDTDLFTVSGTPLADQFLLRAGASGASAFVSLINSVTNVERLNYSGVERIVVNGGFGDDQFAVDDTKAEVTLNGEAGSDTFQISQLYASQRTFTAANVSVDDEFATIETTRGFLSNGISAPMTINGGDNDDHFIVFHNKSVLLLNGDNGDDLFDIRAFALAGSQEPQRGRTDVSGGGGADFIQYAVNSPVDVNGGDGFDTVKVIGTEFGDDFVVTRDGVYGGGLNVRYVNIESLRVDCAEGDDRVYVESTSEKVSTEILGGLGNDTVNLSGEMPPVVSNDLRGHNGIITNGVESTDSRFQGTKAAGISAHVADNDEPGLVFVQTGGTTRITEGDTVGDSYQVFLTREPSVAIFVKALAPIPTPDERERKQRAFAVSSTAQGAVNSENGTSVTLRFTAANWFIPQTVFVVANNQVYTDSAGILTRPELGDTQSFTFNDAAYEGLRQGVINHIVQADVASISGRLNRGAVAAVKAAEEAVLQISGTVVKATDVFSVTVDHGTLISSTGSTTVSGALDSLRTAINNAKAQAPSGSVLKTLTATRVVERKISFSGGIDAGDTFTAAFGSRVVTFTVPTSGVRTASQLAASFAAAIQAADVSGVSVDARAADGSVLLKMPATTAFVSSNPQDSGSPSDITVVSTTQLLILNSDQGVDYEVTVSRALGSNSVIQINVDGSEGATMVVTANANFTARLVGRLIEVTSGPGAGQSRFVTSVRGSVVQVDRAWNSDDAPTFQSGYLIRMDDAFVGLPAAVNNPQFTLTDAAAQFPVAGEGLRGRILSIVGGPGAGQQRMILSNTGSTVTLNGVWSVVPTVNSIYRIDMYSGMAVPGIGVEIADNDQPGLIIDESGGFAAIAVADRSDATSIIEAGDGNQIGEQDVVRVRLSTDPGSTPVKVQLRFDSTILKLQNLNGTSIAGNRLTFTGGAQGNWNQFQTVRVSAINDLIRQGLHTSLIVFEVVAGKSDSLENISDVFTIASDSPQYVVGLTATPRGAAVTVTRNGVSIPTALSNSTGLGYELSGNKVIFKNNGSNTPVFGTIRVTYTRDYMGYIGASISSASWSAGQATIRAANTFRVNQTVTINGITSGGLGNYNGTFVITEATSSSFKYALLTDPGAAVVSDISTASVNNSGTAQVLVQVYDDDAPEVLIRETNGSTDVAEGSSGIYQQTDDYFVVLTRSPEAGKTVSVRVTPQITKTTRTGGIRHDAVQLGLSSSGISPNSDGSLTIVFNDQNWDTPVRVFVSAVDDNFVDGGDTRVFAPRPHTLSGIQGPLNIEGGGGLGSLERISAPVMLGGETNIRSKTGDVVSVVGPSITVQTADLQTYLGGPLLTSLVGRTLEITSTVDTGPARSSVIGQFREIRSFASSLNGTTVLTLNAPFDFKAGEQQSQIKTYAITQQSLNFFVNESTQVDRLFASDVDSLADSSGTITNNRISGFQMGPDISIGGQKLVPGGVMYGNLEVLQVDLGGGFNEVTVVGAPTRSDGYATRTFLNSGDDRADTNRPLVRVGDRVSINLAATVSVTAARPVSSAARATSSRFAALTDTGASFGSGINGLAGQMLEITAGSGKGQKRRVLSNTSQTVFLNTDWEVQPDTSSRYTITNEADGNFAVNTAGGDDWVDATRSSREIVIFGGAGADQINSGNGNDIVFGDEGRVDYKNEIGAIVTRLGTAPPAIVALATGPFTNNSQLNDSGAHFPVPDLDDTGLKGLYVTITDGKGLGQRPRLITGNTKTTLTVTPAWDSSLDSTSRYRISTLPENQTDGSIPTSVLALCVNPLSGAADIINSGGGNDFVAGGSGGDTINGNTGNDLVFGDYGRLSGNVSLQQLPRAGSPSNFSFNSISTNSGGGSDLIYGGTGDDILIGGQEFDRLLGENGNDDLIGGHNVAGGKDVADWIDGGPGSDAIAGDNATILRESRNTDVRWRTLTGTELVSASGSGSVTATWQQDPGGQPVRTIVLLDHSTTTAAGFYGDDDIAGGSGNDIVFGQLGSDAIQGDGNLLNSAGQRQRDVRTTRVSADDVDGAETDGDDYIEGGGGNDTILGNLGQDDLIGGSSSLFAPNDAANRPDGGDLIFGGSGNHVARNDSGDLTINGHARDADVMLGDNGNIFRIVGINGVSAGRYSTFAFDTYGSRRIIPRTTQFLDYAFGTLSSSGLNDEMHGESGDDIIHGMSGNDVLFGDGQDDSLTGGQGSDRIFGGSGEDGILGDDGRIFTSRNGLTEPLYGITTPSVQANVTLTGTQIGAMINITGRLKQSVDLGAYYTGGADILYGGLGDDFIHGGAGDDAVSGAEATVAWFVTTSPADSSLLNYSATTRMFEAYKALDPLSKINNFLLNFEAVDQQNNKVNDGIDHLFGNEGNDWLVGGTMSDRLFGGMGDDLLNADDNLETSSGLNNIPDPTLYADADFAFGGGGYDVMIANTGADRLIDWSKRFNTYVVPIIATVAGGQLTSPTVLREPSNPITDLLVKLGLSGGGDQDVHATANQFYAELGLVTSEDGATWQAQIRLAANRDPAPTNLSQGLDTSGTPESLPAALINIRETSPLTVSELGTYRILHVTLTSPPLTDVILQAVSQSNSEVSVSPATLTFTKLNWSIPQQITLKGVDDALQDGSRSVNVTVQVDRVRSDAAYASAPAVIVIVINTDNELSVAAVNAPSFSSGPRQPTFTWSAASGPAVRYELKIDRIDVAQTDLIRLSTLTAATFTVPTPMAAGSYRVWIRAISSSGVIGDWSTPLNFTVASVSTSQLTPEFDVLAAIDRVFENDLLFTSASVTTAASGSHEATLPAEPPLIANVDQTAQTNRADTVLTDLLFNIGPVRQDDWQQ